MTKKKKPPSSPSRATPRAAVAAPAAAPPVEMVLPPGLQLEKADGVVTVVWAGADLGDAFALAFLGVVIALFALGVGTQAFGWPAGTIGGGVIALVACAPLLRGALGRAVDKTTVVVRPGEVVVKTGPIRRSERRFGKGEVTSFTVRQSEHRSMTRGGTQTVQRTYSVWALLKDGSDVSLVEPLQSDGVARHVEHALKAALA